MNRTIISDFYLTDTFFGQIAIFASVPFFCLFFFGCSYFLKSC